jgi:hypothetical protein
MSSSPEISESAIIAGLMDDLVRQINERIGPDSPHGATAQLAAQAGMTFANFSKVLRERKAGLKILVKIARGLHITAYYQGFIIGPVHSPPTATQGQENSSE